jgi:excisionase family DNA binding protein
MHSNASTNPNSEFLTTTELAKRLRVSRQTVIRRARDGEIPVIALGPRVRRFHWPTVARALEAR